MSVGGDSGNLFGSHSLTGFSPIKTVDLQREPGNLVHVLSEVHSTQHGSVHQGSQSSVHDTPSLPQNIPD